MGMLLDHPQLEAFQSLTRSAERDAFYLRIETQRRELGALLLAMTATIDATCAYTDDAHRSTACWVQAVVNGTPYEAREWVRSARMIRDLPAVGDAFAQGHIGPAQIDAFTRLHNNERVAPFLADAVELLIEHASLLPQPDFVTVCQRFQAWADPDGDNATHETSRRNRTMSQSREGAGFRIRVRGDALSGSVIEAALEPFITAEFDADWSEGVARYGDGMHASLMARTPTQRRFDAFANMCAAAGDGTGVPTVSIICDQDTAEEAICNAFTDPAEERKAGRRSGAGTGHDYTWAEADTTTSRDTPSEMPSDEKPGWIGRRCETATDHEPVSRNDLLAALLIGNVRKVVADQHGRTIFLGHRKRLFTGAAREAALLGGDRCIHPGCHIRGGRIHIDHTIAWARTRTRGPTDPDNADVECPHHDLAKERLHLSVEPHATMPDTWITRRENGTIIGPRTSPCQSEPTPIRAAGWDGHVTG
ncbi:MAG: DUF222 domain-containing protein [Ilumatobacteraceae bacterium]